MNESDIPLCPIPEWLVDGEFRFTRFDVNVSRGLGATILFLGIWTNSNQAHVMWSWAGAHDIASNLTLKFVGPCHLSMTIRDRDLVGLVGGFNEWLMRRNFRQEGRKWWS